MSFQINANQLIEQQVSRDSNNIVAVTVDVEDIYKLSLKLPCDCVNYEKPVYKIGSDGCFDEKSTPPKMKNNNFVITPYNFNSPESAGSSYNDPNIDHACFANFAEKWFNYVSDDEESEDIEDCEDSENTKYDEMLEQNAAEYDKEDLYYKSRISQYYEDQENDLQCAEQIKNAEQINNQNQDNIQYPPGFTPKLTRQLSSIKKNCIIS